MEDRIIKDGRVKEGNILKADTLLEIERLHPDIERWFLDTIKEEAGNCHLYEKIGNFMKKTGKWTLITCRSLKSKDKKAG